MLIFQYKKTKIRGPLNITKTVMFRRMYNITYRLLTISEIKRI